MKFWKIKKENWDSEDRALYTIFVLSCNTLALFLPLYCWYIGNWKMMIIFLICSIPTNTIHVIVENYLNKMNIKDYPKDFYTISLFFNFIIDLPLIIYAYAKFYEFHGLYRGGNLTKNFEDCLYFSIVTWTTLGYGDLHPNETIQLWAAFQALFGNLYMAIIIAGLIYVMKIGKK